MEKIFNYLTGFWTKTGKAFSFMLSSIFDIVFGSICSVKVKLGRFVVPSQSFPFLVGWVATVLYLMFLSSRFLTIEGILLYICHPENPFLSEQ